MDIQLSVAIIGVVSALSGTAIGGLTSYFSSRSMRKLEWRLTQIDKEIDKRENLYAAFLGEANRWVIFSVNNKVQSLEGLDHFLSLESKIRLISPEIGDLARKITSCILDNLQKDKNAEVKYPDLRDSFIVSCQLSIDKLRRSI